MSESVQKLSRCVALLRGVSETQLKSKASEVLENDQHQHGHRWWMDPIVLEISDPRASEFMEAANEVASNFAQGQILDFGNFSPLIRFAESPSDHQETLDRTIRNFVLDGVLSSNTPENASNSEHADMIEAAKGTTTCCSISQAEIASLVDGIDFDTW